MAIVFETIIAATEPEAVIAILRELNVERRLVLIVEAGNFLNEGVVTALFGVVLMSATRVRLTPGIAGLNLL